MSDDFLEPYRCGNKLASDFSSDEVSHTAALRKPASDDHWMYVRSKGGEWRVADGVNAMNSPVSPPLQVALETLLKYEAAREGS